MDNLDSQPFYYLHIPKTAGTTFCFSVLPYVFNPADICPAHDYPELLPLLGGDLGRYRLFRGHFYYFFEKLLPVRPIFMTFLRNPVERVLSLYDHICRDTGHFQHQAMTSLKRGLEDAIRLQHLLPPNFQVTSLASNIDPIQTMNDARAEDTDEYAVIYGAMTKRVPTADDLATARRRIQEMEFVGIVEKFHDSVGLLCRTFGWTVPVYKSLNIAPARTLRDRISPAIVKEIEKANEMDFALYEFARSVFLERLRLDPAL